MRVYLAGPMTGLLDYNDAGFTAAARYVTDWLDAVPVSPQNTDPTHEGSCPEGPWQDARGHRHPYQCWLRASLRLMLTCEAIYLLPGWERSNGATLERDVAIRCGMRVLTHETERE